MGAKTRKLSQINDSLIEWQSVVVADGSTGLTAVAGRGYFINTTGGAITVTLPSATVKPGDTIQLKDYARKWATNNVTIASNLFDGSTSAAIFSTNGQTVTLVYMDNTKGWSIINEDTTTNLGAQFITATGGTITTSGNFKIHSFTGDGCLVVSSLGNPAGGGSNVDYLVVAGGGAGGAGDSGGGGGGAGGYRTTFPSPGCNAGSFPISATTYPITVGGGGSSVGPGVPSKQGTSGSNSIFSTITSTGGGGGGGWNNQPGVNGGSGGGSGNTNGAGAGSGNTPPTSPSQGNNGGNAQPSSGSYMGGGGGAGEAGSTDGNGQGGDGSSNSITGSPIIYAGGGGGSFGNVGGDGGGGLGGATTPTNTNGTAGSVNTGGGGGGNGGPATSSGAGGSGIVIIRYKFQ